MSAFAANTVVYLPETVRRMAILLSINHGNNPPSYDKALQFLQRAVSVEEQIEAGPLRSKKITYSIADQPSMMFALATFYGKHAYSGNAQERSVIVSSVLKELENKREAERLSKRKEKRRLKR